MSPIDIYFFLIISDLCERTNVYACGVGVRSVSLYERWRDVDVEEVYMFISLLM